MSLRDKPRVLDWFGVGLRVIGLGMAIRDERRRAGARDPYDYFTDFTELEWAEVPNEFRRLVMDHIEEVELDEPKESEVLVKLTASGLCHSDEHLVTGDIPMPFPVVGGHEGAGVVAGTGANVTHVAEGDSVVLSFLPSCGRCSYQT